MYILCILGTHYVHVYVYLLHCPQDQWGNMLEVPRAMDWIDASKSIIL